MSLVEHCIEKATLETHKNGDRVIDYDVYQGEYNKWYWLVFGSLCVTAVAVGNIAGRIKK